MCEQKFIKPITKKFWQNLNFFECKVGPSSFFLNNFFSKNVQPKIQTANAQTKIYLLKIIFVKIEC